MIERNVHQLRETSRPVEEGWSSIRVALRHFRMRRPPAVLAFVTSLPRARMVRFGCCSYLCPLCRIAEGLHHTYTCAAEMD